MVSLELHKTGFSVSSTTGKILISTQYLSYVYS